MENLALIGIGIILFVVFVIHPMRHFIFQRRIETILITIAGILLFSEFIAPIFNLEFDVKDNVVSGIFFIVFTAFISDYIMKK